VVSLPPTLLLILRRGRFLTSLPKAIVYGSFVAGFHTLVLPFLLVWFWFEAGVRLLKDVVLELADSLRCCGREKDNEDEIDASVKNHKNFRAWRGERKKQRGVDGFRSADTRRSGTGGRGRPDSSSISSVAQLLKETEFPGRPKGWSVAEIWDYLEHPTTIAGLAIRKEQQERAATWAQVNQWEQCVEWFVLVPILWFLYRAFDFSCSLEGCTYLVEKPGWLLVWRQLTQTHS